MHTKHLHFSDAAADKDKMGVRGVVSRDLVSQKLTVFFFQSKQFFDVRH